MLNGVGPNGKPDGGVTCQSPTAYANYNTGWQGAGPSWQAFHLYDNDLTYTYQSTNSVLKANFYNSLYDNPWDRTFRFPNYGYPGSNASWRDTGVNESGFVIGDDFPTPLSNFEIGTSYMNNAYFQTTNSNNDGVADQHRVESGCLGARLLRPLRVPPTELADCRLRQRGQNRERNELYLSRFASLDRRSGDVTRHRSVFGRQYDDAAESRHAQQGLRS